MNSMINIMVLYTKLTQMGGLRLGIDYVPIVCSDDTVLFYDEHIEG